MKLSTILATSAAVLLGVAACAAPADEHESPGEDIDSTSQALSPRHPGASSGLTSGGFFEPPPSYPTFSCVSTGKDCSNPNYKWLSCNPADPNVCVCMQGCGGGGWPYGTLNPCPYYARNYTCSPAGSCRCSP